MMIRSCKYLICLLMGMVPAAALAQFLDYGVDPLRYKWNQVDLEHYKLIYPRGLDSLAYRYALYLENVYEPVGQTVGRGTEMRFPVVLHPGNMVPNGMVSWAPRRMELLTTPSFRQHAEPWERHLIVHESRHVRQTGKLLGGVFRPFYYLMGEQAAGLAAAFVPRWFFEGDAVATETALTDAGRGRLPEFQMIYRTQKLLGSFYSFDKWHFGSYKDNTGTFYTLGYGLASFARYKYGSDIWDKTTTRYTRHPVSFPTFSNAFKKHTGSGFSQLFKETYAFLGNEWASLDSGYAIPAYLSPETKQYTSYQYPQALNDSTIISVKSSYKDITSIVALANGKEKRLAYAGAISGRILLHGNRVYWMETVPGLRWTQESHSQLKYYDLDAARVKTFAPAWKRMIHFAVSDSILAAALFTEEGQSQVALLDMNSGKETARFDSPGGNTFIKEITWGEGAALYALIVGDEGAGLYALDTRNGTWEALMETTRANISSLAWEGNRLAFESGLEGINNIYGLDLQSRTAHRLTSSRFGAFQPSFTSNGEGLLFADYQGKGYRIAALPPDSLAFHEADFSRPYRYALAETVSQQEGTKVNLSSLQPVAFNPRPYRKLSRLFNVHSWAPIYYSINDVSDRGDAFTLPFKPGASLISQNALNTAVSQVGWYYDRNNGGGHGVLNFTYKGLLPVFSVDIDYGGKAYDMLWVEDGDKNKEWTPSVPGRSLLSVKAQAYIPFNFSRNQYLRSFRPTLSYYFTNNRLQQYETRRLPFYQYLQSELLFYNYRRMAQQEILPRWGFQFRLQQLSMPFNTDNFGDLYAARLTTYWPGIARTHSLMLRFGYQHQDLGGKAFYSPHHLLDAPRGHFFQYNTQRQAALKADYAFPLAMPDFSIGSLAYIRRIRANFFYDLNHNQDYNKRRSRQSSSGADLLFDWNALRFYYSLISGVRLTQPLGGGGGKLRIELVSSISF